MSDRPNVLFIMSDQHNAKILGCAGNDQAITPNLDAMAAGGVRFTSAVTQNTICTPSRVCDLSGQYCHNHGYYALSGPRPRGLPTVLGHFRRAGYRTAVVGKSHCPEYWLEDDCDEFHDVCGTAIGGRSAEYRAYLAQRGVDIDIERTRDADCNPSPFEYADSEEGWGARKAIDIMKRAVADGTPFCIHYSMPKPHGPYTPSKRFWDLYEDVELPMPPNADYDLVAAGKAPHLISVTEWCARDRENYAAWRKRKLRAYYANVTHSDHAVGELLAHLDEAGLAENTVVVYTADHGEYVCEHGPSEKVPGIAADAVTRIPMIWRWKGKLKAGHVAPEVVEAVDIVPTLCALAGVDPMLTADGRDISGMLAGAPGDADRLGVTEYPLSKSVRKGKWRMVYYPDGFFRGVGPEHFGELYDLDADPWEMKNLYFRPEHAGTVRRLERELMDWMMFHTRPTTIQAITKLDGPQVTRRYGGLPSTPDGKLPWQQLELNLGGGPHM